MSDTLKWLRRQSERSPPGAAMMFDRAIDEIEEMRNKVESYDRCFDKRIELNQRLGAATVDIERLKRALEEIAKHGVIPYQDSWAGEIAKKALSETTKNSVSTGHEND